MEMGRAMGPAQPDAGGRRAAAAAQAAQQGAVAGRAAGRAWKAGIALGRGWRARRARHTPHLFTRPSPLPCGARREDRKFVI